MKTIQLVIDGRRIAVDEGTTILEAARQNGIYIPTLCHHPRLAPLGHCRICVVEVEGLARPITACDNPVAEGMKVTTHTVRLQEMRREILSLLLSTHPYRDCLTCEKGGACELQEAAYRFQVELPPALEKEPACAVTDENPYIARDAAKCILCGRCLQVCHAAGRSVYRLEGKGVETQVIAGRAGSAVTLEEAGCNFCGRCVDVCPVGALTERERAGGGREWQLQAVPGVCVECSLVCPLERRVLDGNLVKVTVPREGEPAGWLCARGKFGINGAAGEGEIAAPLIREGDAFREAGFEEALQAAAAAFREIKVKHGGGALAVLGGGNCTNEESFLLQKLARAAMGTPHVDLGVDPAWAQAAEAVYQVTGPGTCGPSLAELREAGAVLIIGDGLEHSAPVAAMNLAEAARYRGTALVRLGSGGADPAAWESLRLPLSPGGESALFRALTAALRGETAKEAARRAGAEPALIERAARLIKGGASCTLVCPSFLHEASDGAVEALLEMLQAAGQLAPNRCKVLLLAAPGNARGILETGGVAHLGPGYTPAGERGLNRAAVLNGIKKDRIKGIFAWGDCLAGEDLSGLDFLAVQCAARCDLPAEANVVFPARPIHLLEGSFTGAAGRVHGNMPAAAAGGEDRPGWRVICDLAGALGTNLDVEDLEDVRRQMRGLVPGF